MTSQFRHCATLTVTVVARATQSHRVSVIITSPCMVCDQTDDIITDLVTCGSGDRSGSCIATCHHQLNARHSDRDHLVAANAALWSQSYCHGGMTRMTIVWCWRGFSTVVEPQLQ